MAVWKRLLITLVAMLAAGFIAGQIWKSTFNTLMPGYLGGIIGGLTALPVWELLKRFSPKT